MGLEFEGEQQGRAPCVPWVCPPATSSSSGGGGGGSGNAVLYTPQTPDSDEKLQARINIGVGPSDSPTWAGATFNGGVVLADSASLLGPDGAGFYVVAGVTLFDSVAGTEWNLTTDLLTAASGATIDFATGTFSDDWVIPGAAVVAGPGEVILTWQGGSKTYKPAGDTDLARGNALVNALDKAKELADADGINGFGFVGPLTFDGVSTFYGVATMGGTSHSVDGGSIGGFRLNTYKGWTNGVVFKLTTAPDYTFLHRFSDSEPWNPQCGLVLVTAIGGNDYLYGMGGESNSSSGQVWRIRMSDSTFQLITGATLTSTTGTRPYGMPIKATDGDVYFTCSHAGDATDNDYLGTICKFTPVASTTHTLTKVATFSSAVGANPNSGLVQGADVGGQMAFYGVCSSEGRCEIASASVAADTLITTSNPHGLVTGNVVTIGGRTGDTPTLNGTHAVTVVSPTTFHFTTPINLTVSGTGGYVSYGFGALFSYVVGTGVTYLHVFTGGTDGAYPVGGLLYDSGTLIGTTKQGGTNGLGSVFKYVIGTSTYTANFAAFAGLSGSGAGVLPGAHPVSALTKGSDNQYYGTAMEGGTYNLGCVFKLTTGGTGSVVTHCNGRAGYYPRGGVTEDANTNLWYTTQLGGKDRAGDVCSTPMSATGASVADQQYASTGANARAILSIGPGTFELEPQRITYGEFTIQGSGMDVTVLKCKDDTWYKGMFGGTWSFFSCWQSRLSSPRELHVRDLTLDCNVAGQAVNYAGAPTTRGNVAFSGFDAYATESSFERIRLINMGGTQDATQQIYGLWFTSAGLQGLYYYVGTQSHGIAEGNRIIDCESSRPYPLSQGLAAIIRNGGDDAEDYLTIAGNGWSRNPTISGCKVRDYHEWSGGAVWGYSGQQTQGWEVLGCSADNMGPLGAGIRLDGHPSIDSLIQGFICDRVANGIAITFSSPTISQTNMRITDCLIRATTAGIVTSVDSPGLQIDNNTIVAPTGLDLTDQGSVGVVIQNNLIDASGTAISADWATPPTMFNNKDADGNPLPDDGLRTGTLLLGEAIGSSAKAHVRGACDQLLSGTVTWTAASTTITNQAGKTNWGNTERKQLCVGSHINLGGAIARVESIISNTDPQTATIGDVPGTNGTNAAAYTDGDLLLVEDKDGTPLFSVSGTHWTQIGGALVLGTPHRFNDASPPVGQMFSPSNVLSSSFGGLLSGGVSVTGSSTTLNGDADTLFQDEVTAGDLLSVQGIVREVASVDAQNQITLLDAHPGTGGDTVVFYKVPATHVYTDSNGFIQMHGETTVNINAVSGINVEGNGFLNLFATGGTITIGESTGDISIAGELPSLSLGKTGSSTGELHLLGTTSGEVIIKVSAAAGSYTLTLPTDDGGSGQFLQTDGSGVLSWQTVSSGITIGSTAIASGTDTRVLFQDGTTVGEDAGMTYNKTTDSLTLVGGVSSATIVASTSGAIGLGATSPPTAFVVGDTSTSSPRGIMSWQSNTGTDGARLHLRKSRGTFGTPLAVAASDTLGRLVASGYVGATNGFIEMASIDVTVPSTGTINDTSTGRLPTQILFKTATDASPSVLTTALTLGADQKAIFASDLQSGGGVTRLSGTEIQFYTGTTQKWRWGWDGSQMFLREQVAAINPLRVADTTGFVTLGFQTTVQGALISSSSTSLGGAAAAATTNTKIVKLVSSIADATATTVLTITIPNATHAASVRVTLLGRLGAGGTIGADEAAGTISYDISVARTAGVLAVATISTAYGSATSNVVGADTITVAGTIAHGGEAVGVTNTYLVKVTITKGGGASANHKCTVMAEVLNANATGITIA